MSESCTGTINVTTTTASTDIYRFQKDSSGNTIALNLQTGRTDYSDPNSAIVINDVFNDPNSALTGGIPSNYQNVYFNDNFNITDMLHLSQKNNITFQRQSGKLYSNADALSCKAAPAWGIQNCNNINIYGLNFDTMGWNNTSSYSWAFATMTIWYCNGVNIDNVITQNCVCDNMHFNGSSNVKITNSQILNFGLCDGIGICTSSNFLVQNCYASGYPQSPTCWPAPSGYAYGVYGSNNVTIKDCTGENAGYSQFLSQPFWCNCGNGSCSPTTIPSTNVTFDHCTAKGAGAGFTNANWQDGTRNSNINWLNCTASGQYAHGFQINSLDNSLIKCCTSNNANNGIELNDSKYITVEQCYVHDNPNYGIIEQSNSDHNTIDLIQYCNNGHNNQLLIIGPNTKVTNMTYSGCTGLPC